MPGCLPFRTFPTVSETEELGNRSGTASAVENCSPVANRSASNQGPYRLSQLVSGSPASSRTPQQPPQSPAYVYFHLHPHENGAPAERTPLASPSSYSRAGLSPGRLRTDRSRRKSSLGTLVKTAVAVLRSRLASFTRRHASRTAVAADTEPGLSFHHRLPSAAWEDLTTVASAGGDSGGGWTLGPPQPTLSDAAALSHTSRGEQGAPTGAGFPRIPMLPSGAASAHEASSHALAAGGAANGASAPQTTFSGGTVCGCEALTPKELILALGRAAAVAAGPGHRPGPGSDRDGDELSTVGSSASVALYPLPLLGSRHSALEEGGLGFAELMKGAGRRAGQGSFGGGYGVGYAVGAGSSRAMVLHTAEGPLGPLGTSASGQAVGPRESVSLWSGQLEGGPEGPVSGSRQLGSRSAFSSGPGNSSSGETSRASTPDVAALARSCSSPRRLSTHPPPYPNALTASFRSADSSCLDATLYGTVSAEGLRRLVGASSDLTPTPPGRLRRSLTRFRRAHFSSLSQVPEEGPRSAEARAERQRTQPGHPCSPRGSASCLGGPRTPWSIPGAVASNPNIVSNTSMGEGASSSSPAPPTNTQAPADPGKHVGESRGVISITVDTRYDGSAATISTVSADTEFYDSHLELHDMRSYVVVRRRTEGVAPETTGAVSTDDGGDGGAPCSARLPYRRPILPTDVAAAAPTASGGAAPQLPPACQSPPLSFSGPSWPPWMAANIQGATGRASFGDLRPLNAASTGLLDTSPFATTLCDAYRRVALEPQGAQAKTWSHLDRGAGNSPPATAAERTAGPAAEAAAETATGQDLPVIGSGRNKDDLKLLGPSSAAGAGGKGEAMGIGAVAAAAAAAASIPPASAAALAPPEPDSPAAAASRRMKHRSGLFSHLSYGASGAAATSAAGDAGSGRDSGAGARATPLLGMSWYFPEAVGGSARPTMDVGVSAASSPSRMPSWAVRIMDEGYGSSTGTATGGGAEEGGVPRWPGISEPGGFGPGARAAPAGPTHSRSYVRLSVPTSVSGSVAPGLSLETSCVLQVNSPNEVHLDHLIGRGCAGRVYQGTWRGETVAVKVLSHTVPAGATPGASGANSEDQIKQLEQEAALGICLDHPNIVATYAAFTTVSSPPPPPQLSPYASSMSPRAPNSHLQGHMPDLPTYGTLPSPRSYTDMPSLAVPSWSRTNSIGRPAPTRLGRLPSRVSHQVDPYGGVSGGVAAPRASNLGFESNPQNEASAAATPATGMGRGTGSGMGAISSSDVVISTPFSVGDIQSSGQPATASVRSASPSPGAPWPASVVGMGAVVPAQSPLLTAPSLAPGGGLGSPAPCTTWETFIVMELCPCGSLRAALDAKKLHDKKGNPKLHEVLPLAWQVSCALQYLHANGVVHGDLKAANVMLVPAPSPPTVSLGDQPGDSSGPTNNTSNSGAGGSRRSSDERQYPTYAAKVADFSHSHQVELALRRLRQAGGAGSGWEAGGELASPSHAAPELFEEGGRPSFQSDIYSLGIVLWELYCGRRPYDKYTVGEVMASKRSVPTQQVLPIPGTWCPEYGRLVAACWRPPGERPTLDTAVTTLVLLCRTRLPHIQLCYPLAVSAEDLDDGNLDVVQMEEEREEGMTEGGEGEQGRLTAAAGMQALTSNETAGGGVAAAVNLYGAAVAAAAESAVQGGPAVSTMCTGSFSAAMYGSSTSTMRFSIRNATAASTSGPSDDMCHSSQGLPPGEDARPSHPPSEVLSPESSKCGPESSGSAMTPSSAAQDSLYAFSSAMPYLWPSTSMSGPPGGVGGTEISLGTSSGNGSMQGAIQLPLIPAAGRTGPRLQMPPPVLLLSPGASSGPLSSVPTMTSAHAAPSSTAPTPHLGPYGNTPAAPNSFAAGLMDTSSSVHPSEALSANSSGGTTPRTTGISPVPYVSGWAPRAVGSCSSCGASPGGPHGTASSAMVISASGAVNVREPAAVALGISAAAVVVAASGGGPWLAPSGPTPPSVRQFRRVASSVETHPVNRLEPLPETESCHLRLPGEQHRSAVLNEAGHMVPLPVLDMPLMTPQPLPRFPSAAAAAAAASLPLRSSSDQLENLYQTDSHYISATVPASVSSSGTSMGAAAAELPARRAVDHRQSSPAAYGTQDALTSTRHQLPTPPLTTKGSGPYSPALSAAGGGIGEGGGGDGGGGGDQSRKGSSLLQRGFDSPDLTSLESSDRPSYSDRLSRPVFLGGKYARFASAAFLGDSVMTTQGRVLGPTHGSLSNGRTSASAATPFPSPRPALMSAGALDVGLQLPERHLHRSISSSRKLSSPAVSGGCPQAIAVQRGDAPMVGMIRCGSVASYMNRCDSPSHAVPSVVPQYTTASGALWDASAQVPASLPAGAAAAVTGPMGTGRLVRSIARLNGAGSAEDGSRTVRNTVSAGGTPRRVSPNSRMFTMEELEAVLGSIPRFGDAATLGLQAPQAQQ